MSYMFLSILSPNQFPFLPECFATPLAVGDGVEFLHASVVALLRPALVRRAILVLDGEVLLHWLVESQLTFQVVEHCPLLAYHFLRSKSSHFFCNALSSALS